MKKVKKLNNFFGRFSVDGDKSVTIRAVLLGALAHGKTVIKSPLICEDTLAALDCAKKLGAKVERENEVITITGAQKITDGAVFNCKNSGTTARLLIGALAGAKVSATVVGDKSLSARKMDGIITPLAARGAKIQSKNGKLPITVSPAELTELEYSMPCDSAQVKSAVLLSGLTSGKKTVVIERNSTRKHTENALKLFGADLQTDGKKITLQKSKIHGAEICVPKDISSGAYYAALGLLCGEVTVASVPIESERFGFYEILKNAGAKLIFENESLLRGVKTADITARRGKINYFEVPAEELPSLIDEAPLIAVIAAFNGGCKICGAGALANKESDRLNGTAELLTAFGGEAEVLGDSLIIHAVKPAKSAKYGSSDHRMLMCAFVLASAAEGGTLCGERWVNVSFPNFFNNLNGLRGALFGSNVEKSFSAAIHKSVLSALNQENFGYEQISCRPTQFKLQIKKPAYRLINATFPYKKELFLSSNSLTENAKKSESVNFMLDGVGYSTDGAGLLFSLVAEGGFTPENATVLVMGAGGAGRSIAVAFAEAGAKVYILNRTQSAAKAFCEKCGKVGLSVNLYGGEACRVVINACSTGSPQFFTPELLDKAELAIDINYKKPSAVLDAAKKAKIPVKNGEKMLFYQAYLFDCVIAEKTPELTEGKALCEKFFSDYSHLLME